MSVSDPSPGKHLGAYFLVFFVGAFLYLPTCWNGFVYDDGPYVLQNIRLQEPLDLRKVFTETFPPHAKDQGLYRPLTTLSLYLDRSLWGFAAEGEWNGFHFTNGLIHGLNGALLLGLLGYLGMGFRTRFISSLAFLVHPAMTEAVAWVVGRSELLSMSLGLLAMLCFLRFQTTGWGLCGSVILWWGAMLCKEHWMVLPGLMACLIYFFPQTRRFSRNQGWGLLVVTAVLAVIFWRVRYQLIGSWSPSLVAYGMASTLERVATVAKALWSYILLWLWPVSLSIHHEVELITEIRAMVIPVAAWGVVLWAGWRVRKTLPWCSLAVAWFWVGMFPVSSLLIPIGTSLAERFMYLGTLFFSPALMGLVSQVTSLVLSKEHRNWVLGLGAAGLLVVSTVCTLVRLEDWRNDLRLWESAVSVYPQSFAIKTQLSLYHLKGALERFEKCKRSYDSENPVHREQLKEAQKMARLARAWAREALQQIEHSDKRYQELFQPRLIQADASSQLLSRKLDWFERFMAASALAKKLKPQEALEAFRKLISDYPEEGLSYEAVGDLYVRLKNPVAARQHFAEALRLGVETAPSYAKYAQVMSELGNKKEALEAYDRSLSLNPRDPVTHYNRGVVLSELGLQEEALVAFRTASRILPRFGAPHLNAAAILIHLGRYAEARFEIDQVLQENPKQPEALELLRKIPGADSDSNRG